MELTFKKQDFYNSIIEYLFVIILALNCNTMWTSYSETLLNKILKVAIVAVTALYIVNGNKANKRDINRILLFGLLAIFYFIVYAVFVNYESQIFLYFLIDVFCIYIFIITAKRNDRGIGILCKYENIILFAAVISLFFWLFGSILGIIKSTGTVAFTWSGSGDIRYAPSYYSLYFETQSINGIRRNTGVFTEAPMYNFNLCVALLVELFCRKETSKSRCAVLIITILTTFSTTGWVMMVIALAAKYIFMQNESRVTQIIKILAVPVIIVVGGFVVWLLVTGKLNTSSGSTRADDFVAGYKAWLTHPLFGAGFRNSDYVKQFMSAFRANNLGFSNSPMQILAQGGIFLATPYIYFIYRWIRSCLKSKDVQWLIFFGCFIFIFTITVVPYNFLTIVLFMTCEFIENPEAEGTKQTNLAGTNYLKNTGIVNS